MKLKGKRQIFIFILVNLQNTLHKKNATHKNVQPHNQNHQSSIHQSII
jgi:hypothetical protein